jgi:predicted transglutaminase-like cysteine proteinase
MRARLVLISLLGSAVLSGAVVALRDDHASTWKALWSRLLQGAESPHAIGQFKVDLIDFANQARLTSKSTSLRLDHELEAWLQAEIDSGLSLDDLNLWASRIQAAWPRYMKVRLCAASAPTLDLVKENFYSHLQQTDSPMTHLACATRSSAGGISRQVLLVTGQRLRDFTPELMHRTTDDAFFNICPHCKTSHISRAQRHQESSSLECPSCQRPYAVIAADTQGRFHYANEYLTGYQPPSIYPRGQSRIEQLFTIWSAVHRNCEYVRDPGLKKEKSDRWQTAVETLTRGMGDCEDSAILLADWLIARGYEARVALGKYGDIGGHAWCVVRLDGMEYLLESTAEGNPDFDHPPLVSHVGSRYIPEVLFDRWNLYVREGRHQPWNGDYWSEKSWLRIDPRHNRLAQPSDKNPSSSASAFNASRSQSQQKDFLNHSQFAYMHRTASQASPFVHLEKTANEPTPWQFPVAVPGSPGTPDLGD